MPPETISGEQLNQTKKIQRLATLYFARGLSIFLMVILHFITDCLNSKELIDNMSDIPLLNALLFVILPFLGGLAGFFLLVSSTSNMVSMMKHLKGGKSVRSLVIKQLFAGVVLLIFGMVCESLTGYHGTFGKFFLNLDNPFPLR